MNRLALWFLALTTFCLTAPGAAQQDTVVANAVRLYSESGDARRTAELLEQRLARGGLLREDSLRAWVYLSHARLALGLEGPATDAVRRAIALEPCLVPSEQLASPPFRSVYRRSRSRSAGCDLDARKVTALSAAVPGLGNLVLGRRLPALLHFTTVGAGAYLTYRFGSRAADLHQSYRQTLDPQSAVAFYDSAARYRWRALGAGSATLVAHLWGVLNARGAGLEHEARIRPYVRYAVESEPGDEGRLAVGATISGVR